jgi:protein-S-isoprenylcysteine O-methyltransferase Ste14
MKSILDEHRPLTGDRQIIANMDTAARASMVNRTHRVVRERAKLMAARRSRVRSLWIPLTICSALLLMICYAVWTVLDGYELTQIGIPDSSDQFLILFVWFLPLSMALLVMVWFRRTHGRSSGEVVR